MNYAQLKLSALGVGIVTVAGFLAWVSAALVFPPPPEPHPASRPSPSPLPSSVTPVSQGPPAQESGLFFASETPGRYYEAPFLQTDVESTVSGILVRTIVRQHFRNPSNQWLEGIYVFPLPEHSAVDHMRMWIGNRFIEGRIQEKDAAAQEYRQAKQEGKRATLVSSARDNIFTTRVANVGPGEHIIIEIHYQDTVRYQDHRYTLRFPMVVAPRYVPGQPAPNQQGDIGTSEGPDAGEITAPIHDPDKGPINPVTFRINLDPGFEPQNISSLYHPIDIQRNLSGTFLITFANGAVPANRDVVLRWEPPHNTDPHVGLFAEQVEDDTYLHGVLYPPGSEDPETNQRARDMVIVVDVSGSMAGTSITQVKEALSLTLDELQPEDRFNVIAFANHTTRLFDDVRPASPDNLTSAKTFFHNLTADGGTEILPALRLALTGKAESERLRQIIVLTDGAIGYEEKVFDLIHRHLGRQRLFLIGIGSAPNGHFMREAAELGRGAFTYIGDVQETTDTMVNLFHKLNHPAVTDLRLEWIDSETPSKKLDPAELFPSHIRDLYFGEPVAFSVKFSNLAIEQLTGRLRLSGQRGSHVWQGVMKLSAVREAPGVAQVWARKKIAQLMNDARRGTIPREESKRQIVSVALAHQLVTPFTSLVAIDQTGARPPSIPLTSLRLATNLPAGWRMNAVMKELVLPDEVMPTVIVPALVALSLPQTATLAQLHLLLGSMLLIFFVGAYVLYCLHRNTKVAT